MFRKDKLREGQCELDGALELHRKESATCHDECRHEQLRNAIEIDEKVKEKLKQDIMNEIKRRDQYDVVYSNRVRATMARGASSVVEVVEVVKCEPVEVVNKKMSLLILALLLL